MVSVRRETYLEMCYFLYRFISLFIIVCVLIIACSSLFLKYTLGGRELGTY